MQRRHVKLLLLAVLISILVVLPKQVDAHFFWDDGWDDERLEIQVVEATYLDYDADGQEDDVLTIFRVLTPKHHWDGGRIDITCALQKPSGDSLAISFSVWTWDGVEITIVWFDFADEPGWYTLYISADTRVYDVDSAFAEHVFDPPGGTDKEPPGAVIMSIEEL